MDAAATSCGQHASGGRESGACLRPSQSAKEARSALHPHSGKTRMGGAAPSTKFRFFVIRARGVIAVGAVASKRRMRVSDARRSGPAHDRGGRRFPTSPDETSPSSPPHPASCRCRCGGRDASVAQRLQVGQVFRPSRCRLDQPQVRKADRRHRHAIDVRLDPSRITFIERAAGDRRVNRSAQG